MKEVWTAIIGFPDYEVSNLGRVGSWKPISMYSLPPTKRRILKPETDKGGYNLACLRKDLTNHRRLVHHIVLEAFIGKRPLNFVGAHNNGVRNDNRAVNLRWDTHKNNDLDKIKHNTLVYGEKQHLSKLTEKLVKQIRKDKRPSRTVAKELGVAKSTITFARNRTTWKQVV